MPTPRSRNLSISRRAASASLQTVLVLQGGGALGAYQWGVCEALFERGVEPDWVIGTSIGAINAALLAGNRPDKRRERLAAFWRRVEQPGNELARWFDATLGQTLANAGTITQGIDGFFSPRPGAWLCPQRQVGVEQASYYDTQPLRDTLAGLLDPKVLAEPAMRLTVGAVAVASGQMHYFDSRSKRHAAADRSHRCIGRIAPRLCCGAHRRRGLLGWRGLFEHPDRSGIRRPSPAQLIDLRGQCVAPARPRAGQHQRGRGPAEGYPVRQPAPKPDRAAEADSSSATCDSRTGSADRRQPRRKAAPPASWRVGAAPPPCMSPICKRRG